MNFHLQFTMLERNASTFNISLLWTSSQITVPSAHEILAIKNHHTLRILEPNVAAMQKEYQQYRNNLFSEEYPMLCDGSVKMELWRYRIGDRNSRL